MTWTITTNMVEVPQTDSIDSSMLDFAHRLTKRKDEHVDDLSWNIDYLDQMMEGLLLHVKKLQADWEEDYNHQGYYHDMMNRALDIALISKLLTNEFLARNEDDEGDGDSMSPDDDDYPDDDNDGEDSGDDD